jgi:codanin-1
MMDLFQENVPNQIDFQHIHQEFIPFFLNYLRDQTIHLLQSSRSATPSPAKTPSAQKLKKTVEDKKGSSSSKRIQLFGASPDDGNDDIKPANGSFFSPNTSVDITTPTLKTPTSASNVGKDQKSSPVNCSVEKNNNSLSTGRSGVDHKGPKSGRNTTSHSGSKSNQDGRSRHRFSLGEFILSPEVTSSNKKKNSPYSSGRKNDRSTENTPSPVPTKSGHKKRLSTESGNSRPCSPAPVFSLGDSEEFPPVGGEGKLVPPRLGMSHFTIYIYIIYTSVVTIVADYRKMVAKRRNYRQSIMNFLHQLSPAVLETNIRSSQVE